MKNLYAFALVLFVSAVAVAQERPKFGLKGGLNISKLNFDNGTNADWRTGYHIGALSHIHVTPSFSLQPELYYSSQGGKFPAGNNTRNLNLSYINLPVLLQYNFANGFRLQGGPQLGFLVGVDDEINGIEQNFYNTNNINSIDVSLPLGISYLGYSGFGVDARYNIGLTDVFEGATEAKNSVFQVGVFYLFDHRHKHKTSARRR